MEGTVSMIKGISLNKECMLSLMMFNSRLSATDMKCLEDDFSLYKEDIDNFAAGYKNIGIIFKLSPRDDTMSRGWKQFVDRVIKKGISSDKLHNLFISKAYDKALLITNKRLLKIDLKMLNEKIDDINYRIESYDQRLSEELEMHEQETEKPKGIFRKVIEVLRM
ncbi:hypothetical protein KY358_03330 [Candidatus Woesearchaeota archaeon]|nr:hypothetical protein [Candidatus Woesearchaeota archaeon]